MAYLAHNMDVSEDLLTSLEALKSETTTARKIPTDGANVSVRSTGVRSV